MFEAVSAILVHENDIFIIRRQNHLRAFPGYYAFPGGKIDAEDRDFRTSRQLLTEFPGYQVGALVRELREELEFDLERAVTEGEVAAIDYFGEAITPPFGRLRFNAHYFKVRLNKRPEFQPDPQEIAWSGWLDHQELYRRYQAGEALMVVPIMNTLRTLSGDIDATGADPFNLRYDETRELPCLELINGVGLIPIPSNTLPPAKETNALLIGGGPSPRVLVDPSPASNAVYRKLLSTLDRRRPDAIFISHHHPDHHELVPRLARELGLPLVCSATTRDYLQDIYAHGELNGLKIATVAAGEVLTHWLGQPVRYQPLPGHDDGMLGLAPDNMAWFFIADLAQEGATVVIPDHGGDMRAYFTSLQRVIDLAPRVLIPSHGMPVGGTELVAKNLRHRQERERQVRHYRDAGLEPEEITRELYGNLEPRLQRLALQNIRQHLRKLAGELPG